jgi:GTP-dependent phosphoenolpyruvate carboxykinase
MEDINQFFRKFGSRLPQQLRDEQEKLASRLQNRAFA